MKQNQEDKLDRLPTWAEMKEQETSVVDHIIDPKDLENDNDTGCFGCEL